MLLSYLSINAEAVSKPAVIVITEKITVEEDTEVILWGGESTGNLRNYIWKQTSGIPQRFSSLRSKRITFTPPNLHKGHHIKINLTVYDKDGTRDTKQIWIFVRNTDRSKPNLPPVAVTGGDQIVKAGQKVYLPCKDSYDPDGYIEKCEWTQTSGPKVKILYEPSGMAYYIPKSNSKVGS